MYLSHVIRLHILNSNGTRCYLDQCYSYLWHYAVYISRLCGVNSKNMTETISVAPRLLPVVSQELNVFQNNINVEKETSISLPNKSLSVLQLLIWRVFTHSFVQGHLKDER